MIAHIIVDYFGFRENKTLGNEVLTQSIIPAYWPAIHDSSDVIASINQSHKQIVQYAKDNAMPEICIMEEDVMFTAPDAWQYFLDNKPAKFDLYLGGAYGLDQREYDILESFRGSVEIRSFAGLHCYIIASRYYDTFLSIPANRHIDDQAGMGEFYICSPMVALQHPGWSATNRSEVNYNYNLDKYLYHG